MGFFSVAFHYIMAYEGHSHCWLTGIFWTLTVMTTLGFSDITFHSDLGRADPYRHR
ncbi:MAG: ion channel [Candidatus Eremiobacteraeota bacterium]|nr:ion channel [Candidatus Eremiobacteraeota bacterium]